jgi:hypothetical protein
MANDASQVSDSKKPQGRKSVNLLPMLFRTDKNSKFLAGTLDQLIQPPQLKRVDAWVGSRITPTYNPKTDFYLESNLKVRQDYQLEPALIVRNEYGETVRSTGYDDLINQLQYEGANVSRLDRLLDPEFYSYDPHIDWDKFVNFESYYWLPNGPASIEIGNKPKEVTSTYNIIDTADGNYYVFSPDGLTPIPQLTLYRGVTYKFNIQSINPFWIKTLRISGTEGSYRVAENNGIAEGTITLRIDETTPQRLFYVSENNNINGGEIIVKRLEENSSIDVEADIVGKVFYTSATGVEFTNGMKVNFIGNVTPEIYRDKEFIVEGVGKSIRLVDYRSLETPERFAPIFDERFDNTSFDNYGFDQSNNQAETPEYVTINRASQDRNSWSRYNRWFHEDVIRMAFEQNKLPVLFPIENRARRPIIEFEADLQLYNFGSFAKPNVQFIDTTTTDVFSEVEGSFGFYVDGEELGQGDRVIFTADTDSFVNSKTYVVNFVNIEGRFRISLEETNDHLPVAGDNIVITKGTSHKGTNWWYNGSEWIFAQQKTQLNQAPRFEIFDNNAVSYSDQSVYDTTFSGSTVFGYGVGTGSVDPVLGFPLKYKNMANQAYYLFENFFTTDQSIITAGDSTYSLGVSVGFIKRNIKRDVSEFVNVWTESSDYRIPILQYNVIAEATDQVEVTAIENPGYQTLEFDVFLNDDKKVLVDEYTLYAQGRRYFVVFNTLLSIGDRVLLRIKSTALPSLTGYYETSPGFTNNPLNGYINEFTLSDLTDHVKTMIDRHPTFSGAYPGVSNMRDLPNLSIYGTRVVSNKNPLAFASYFIANDEFNLVSATRLVAQHYNQFKLSLLDQIAKIGGTYAARRALDIALYNININKDISFPYAKSDMIAYGTDAVTRNYPVTDSRNTVYSLVNNFNLTSLSERSVIVYHTDTAGVVTQLLYSIDYNFDQFDSSVLIKYPLVKGDLITIDDYTSTNGCYVPPTPSKLGLYPKFEPRIYFDDTYAGEPQKVIQGHDGSIMLAYNDYRDEIILEYERRVFNNIKVNYNPDLVDLNKILPGAFRQTEYSPSEINAILSKEFLKWDSFYGFNFTLNSTVSQDPKTWNYRTGKELVTQLPLPGGWRGVYKYFFDTDRPHTHPWEMLGFNLKPEWWDETYGAAPYTRGNLILWQDIEQGVIRDPLGIKTNNLYVRPGLIRILPVDDNGGLLMPSQANIATGMSYNDTTASWQFGDIGPVENAWRRSSLWPFAVQILMALTKPALYASLMFDTSRIGKNLANQYGYGDNKEFPSFDILKIYQDGSTSAAGYSVFLVEAGRQRNRNYVDKLKKEIMSITSRLSHKVGGFISKDKFKITIDSVSPASASTGVTLSNEDYEIFLDKSSPVKSLGISGAIVQKTERGYSIRGYDVTNPYFTCFMPIFGSTDPAITIGGRSETYVEWTPSIGNPMGGFDVTSVSTNSGFRFYRQGQVVKYLERYYRVRVGHNSGSVFEEDKFQSLPSLPIIGGVTVRLPKRYETTTVQIPYGSEYEKIEEVYAVLLGYSKWLESEGVIFEIFNSQLGEVADWNLSAKEMIFWSTQKWAPGSVITLSPFADSLSFSNSNAVVDDITNIFYEYSVLKADGSVLSNNNISVVRDESTFNIQTSNTTDGIYFIKLNLIQKEHTLIMNNYTLFNDVIYDIETGYRQRRIKLSGFVTDNWNGDIFSPGFVYDEALITPWQQYKDYLIGDVTLYAGNYYSAVTKIPGSEKFDFNQWTVLGKKPVAQLLPNFDYKIGQFEDFYSLDVDNFDSSQQALAQHLIGYSPRPYLDNVFVNPTSQYKFYQGFIKEKGTRNTVDKLGKASVISQGSYIDYFENWALRVGDYGAYSTENTIEIVLDELKFKENPQIVKFVQTKPITTSDFIAYVTPSEIVIKPEDYANNPFSTSDDVIDDNRGILPHAGYVRLDDITATAYNKNSLLDIANNRAIKDGDTIWLGFEDNGDWGVYRYTRLHSNIINAEIDAPGESLLLTTNKHHGLSTGDLISISQFDSLIDGVFIVRSVTSLTQFSIASSEVNLTIPFTPGVGLLFKFVSSRFATFDNLSQLSTIGKFSDGEKVWVDNHDGKWAVFGKINNFESWTRNSPPSDYSLNINQRYGYTVESDSTGLKVLTSAPNFYSSTADTYGKIYAYRRSGKGASNINFTGSFGPDRSSTEKYFSSNNNSNFGAAISYDLDTGFSFVGAPLATSVKTKEVPDNYSPVNIDGTPSNIINEGFVRAVNLNFELGLLLSEFGISSPEPQAGANFGHDLAVGSISTTSKILFVSSPGQDAGNGAVFSITMDVVSTASNRLEIVDFMRLPSPAGISGSRFGHSITVEHIGKTVVVGAPEYGTQEGAVFVYKTTDYSSYSLSQTITLASLNAGGQIRQGDRFSSRVTITPDGQYLFISAPKATGGTAKVGKIVIMKYDSITDLYKLNQIIENPYSDKGYDFGTNVEISPDGTTIVVSSLGSSYKPYLTFDTYNSQKLGADKYVLDSDSSLRSSATTFDSGTSKFYSTVKNSGAVFSFTRIEDKYVFSEELFSDQINSDQVYGRSISVNNSGILVGAPGQVAQGDQIGKVYFYDSKQKSLNSWQLLRQQDQLVDVNKIKSVKTINSEEESVVDYVEIIDPFKGKISGFAEQELRYRSLFDPAVYSIGVTGVVTDVNSNWLDDHVGELWWDLSSMKYTWYEQGDAEFRKNNWNTLFPGSMIDVYEWVRTPFLPTQWSSIADTNEGLVQGISGQPKFPDNSVISVKQVWDATSNTFSNIYYYWVKNKVTIPEGTERKISAYDVATLIADPKGQGIKYISILSEDSLMLVNMQPSVIGKKIHLSVDIDNTNNEKNKHTEWLLVQEGNQSSVPTKNLINIMRDSLLGKDKNGMAVPDPTLSDRLKYGISVRPKQSMFKDRISALRILVEYSNSILKQNNIVDLVNFNRLLDKDQIPNSLLRQYDIMVEDLLERDETIVTRNLSLAKLSCQVTNGRITSVNIVDRGFGYGRLNPKLVESDELSSTWIGPKVFVEGSGTGAIIETEVNAVGQVINTTIINPGKDYIDAPSLQVRPFTVIVTLDETVNNRWSMYQWDYSGKKYIRMYTQSFNTESYWRYIDWIDASYNDAQEILATIDSPYQLSVLTEVPANNYVKIRNAGDGRFIIIRKVADSQVAGTYNMDYDLIYQENGTIELLESLWNFRESVYGFDQESGWDQTLFDQTPSVELQNIIDALFEDIFVNYLKVYYNKLFFKLVKYALTEQKQLDWAFKTSFIDVINYAGSLDQRPVYKMNVESYYQDYINETKPYHTKVRNFAVNYTATDVTSQVITDFDLPSVYNTNLRQFTPITFGNSLLNQYPWKSWLDNYTYHIDSVIVNDGGSGYELPPIVEIIPQVGDTGSGAKAQAYIALGKVTMIIVTDPGSGYTVTPRINLVGGGPTTLTPANVSIRMYNGKTRSNMITMKFDRVSGVNEVVDTEAADMFTATGTTNSFKLTWAPNPDKSLIEVKINGIRVLSGDYNIEQYAEKYRGYAKKFGNLVLETVPPRGSIISITYQKDTALYHAADRITNFYAPTDGMPGNTATLLMNGLEYPGVTLDALPFEISKGWDTMPFNEHNWDDYTPEEGLYSIRGPVVTAGVVAANSVGTATTVYFDLEQNPTVSSVKVGATVTTASIVYTVIDSEVDVTDYSRWTLYFDIGVPVNIGSPLVMVNPSGTEYTLPYVPTVGQRINVYVNSTRIDDVNFGTTGTIVNQNAIMPTVIGDGYTNTFDIGILIDSTDIVNFRQESSDGSLPIVDPDFDTYVTGGGYYVNVGGNLELTNSNDLEDINVDGDGLVTDTNSYGPEENLPGRVSDTLGINVFTYPESGAGLVINKKYYRNFFTNTYSIGYAAPSVESIEVNMGGRILTYGVDYTINFENQTITLLGDPLLALRGPYFSTSDALPRKENILNPIASTAGDDTFTGPYNLSFEWNMFGTTYDQIYVGTNGYLTFGGGDSQWTPLRLGQLLHPAIYVEYCDLWQDFGTGGTPLSTGETPGLFLSDGTIGNFNYWRLRFQGSHYNKRDQNPTVPAYQYEVTLYSDGTNQYIEMIYENTWREANFNGDEGFITGVALANSNGALGSGIQVDWTQIQNNTSHVFYSTANGGNWQYAGQGSFDPFKEQDPIPELISITVMDVGGKNLLAGVGATTVNLQRQNNFDFAPAYDDVKSSYVTVNGIKRTDYVLTTDSNNLTGRINVRFNNNLNIGDRLQVRLYAADDKAYSEVNEQLINAAADETTFVLDIPPGNIAPLHNQVIVERDGFRLMPPDTSYYVVDGDNRRFSIENRYDYPQGRPDMASVEVYVNGIYRKFNRSLRLLQDENAVQFSKASLENGDVVAITALIGNDYIISGTNLVLSSSVDISYSSTIKVTTFTNHDSPLFRRERFPGTPTGMFRLSRIVADNNYVWVELNGKPLIRDIDYRLSNDKATVIFKHTYNLTRDDTVVIMSVVNQLADKLAGYRIFYDNLGRTHYKRLSFAHTTQLTADVSATDTSITVEDSSILTPPNLERYRPGVILLNGERIEFFKVEGNRLSALRRGTLGTGVKALHKEGTYVIDQGAGQNIVVTETNEVERFVINGDTYPTTSTWALPTIQFDSTSTVANNEIDVFYRGRLLRKPGLSYTVTDTTIAYDSGETDSLGNSSNVTLQPEFAVNTSTNTLVLGFTPLMGSEIKITRKLVNEIGIEFADLHSRDVSSAKFLLENPSFVMNKYYYGQVDIVDQYITLEDGDTLDSENGDPLIGS